MAFTFLWEIQGAIPTGLARVCQSTAVLCTPSSLQLGHFPSSYVPSNLMRLFSLGALQVFPVPSCFSNE